MCRCLGDDMRLLARLLLTGPPAAEPLNGRR